tara:strand:- start:655 stop:1875 length:1221 start_codon:yes stop_codon:yes gene_type:complete
VNKNKKNFLLENNISKNYYNNNFYLKNKKKLNKIIKNIQNNLDYKKDIFHIFSKKFTLDFKKLQLSKFIKYKTVIIIGMGGSTLGAQSIYSYLKKKISKKFIFIDNLDQMKIKQLKEKTKSENTLFIIISKSGNTIETLINCNLLKNKISSKNSIIITEQKKSLLNIFAKKNNILQIAHKDYIGGRYSVLSEVGMVPAYFMGLKINNFRKNLLSFFKSKENLIMSESIIKLAHIYNSKKIKSIIFLNYAPQLNEFLYWCQQLMAESLGKKGKGILPVVSPVPRDHHSLMQLYLDGPKDKLFYIFSLNLNDKIKINSNIFDKSFNYAQNKELSKVVLAQKKALIKTLEKKNIPFREFKINQINEEILGELFSYFMAETALIGKLIGIDPFNQPAVEGVKNLTKKYLS